jgi:hypothetical protein
VYRADEARTDDRRADVGDCLHWRGEPNAPKTERQGCTARMPTARAGAHPST